MRELRIRPRAAADLEEVWLFTARTWSPRRADDYLRRIHESMVAVAYDPEVGRCMAFLRPGYRVVRSGRHLVFYTACDEAVSVRRVLHDQMQATRHL
ncbi:MAG: type II toxin-antitoxin system RelE/ParE family toxin [Planctomycetes bacterium]|nr:type II toxin-antitoxin system RelE/ParE family toxin [Planctomycetota bacterium]